mgnify:CR=1 FL=1
MVMSLFRRSGIPASEKSAPRTPCACIHATCAASSPRSFMASIALNSGWIGCVPAFSAATESMQVK